MNRKKRALRETENAERMQRMQRVEKNLYLINSEFRKIMNLYNKNRELFDKGIPEERKKKSF